MTSDSRRAYTPGSKRGGRQQVSELAKPELCDSTRRKQPVVNVGDSIL